MTNRNANAQLSVLLFHVSPDWVYPQLVLPFPSPLKVTPPATHTPEVFAGRAPSAQFDEINSMSETTLCPTAF